MSSRMISDFSWQNLARPKPAAAGSPLAKRLMASKVWLAQEKANGWRVLVTLDRRQTVVITTRHGEALTAPARLVDTVTACVPALTKLDCELIRPWKKLIAFDVIQLAGRDMTRAPLSERMMRLGSLLEKQSSPICSVATCLDEKEAFYKDIISAGGEGIVLKRMSDPYPMSVAGHGAGNAAIWIKVKP